MSATDPVKLRIPDLNQDLHLFVHAQGDQVISPRLREEGIWEPYETQLLQTILRPGDTFVDVGANIGYFTVLAAARVGVGGGVFAFEPQPDNFALLEQNVTLNDLGAQVTCVQAGLSDETGEGALYLSEENFGDHQIYASDEPRESTPINLVNGAEFLRERVQKMALLKVDTQGSEARVIAGLLPLLLAMPAAPRIMVELTPHSLREAGSSGRELVEMLARLGEPMWIIDHVEHRLADASAEALALWCDNWDAVEEARGFINILVGEGV